MLGLGADQNSVTMNGMQFGANGLPRDAQLSSSLSTSPYDGSRGNFSGANFNFRPGSGSNFRTRGTSLVFNTPQLEWTDRAAQAVGTEFTNVSLGGVLSGPLVMNKSFYTVSYQLGRQARDNQTLLNTSPLGLATAGIATDSLSRFRDILSLRGIPTAAGPLRQSSFSDNGSVFGSFDFSPPTSSTGQSLGLTVNANWGKQSPSGGGVTQLASALGDRVNWGGGLQGRHSRYFGLLLSETTVGVNVSRNYGDPYLELPAGHVRVSSVLADGASSVKSLTFGGNPSMSSSSRSSNSTIHNDLSWFDDANKHRVKLSTEVGFNGSWTDQSSNLLGTFSFNSLADLAAGQAASFSRTLTARQRSTGQMTGAVAITDSYRRTPDLQIQYSLRIDGSRYTSTPDVNPAVDQIFGRRNDRVPAPLVVSPRIGFSYTLGQNQDISAFFGQARAPRAVVRGGIGVFANGSGVGQIGAALDNTGLPSGVQQIVCVGPAVPIPDWVAYANGSANVPDHCADGGGGTVFSNSAPSVTLFAPHFKPQRSVRANTSWNGAILDARFTANVEATYSLNLNQQRSVDLNFAPTTRFTLADDGRPVFVETASIVPATGSIASRDARVSQTFNRVSEVRSDLQSRSGQLSVRLSPILRGPTTFSWNLAYTYSHIREQVSGFSSTAGNPLDVIWAASGQGPHQFNYTLRYNMKNAVQFVLNGSFRSGSAFTPTISGDVNGDGYSNDRAFVYAPTTAADAALADGMRLLLDGTKGATHECLERQIGTIASRNSCRGPWQSNADLTVTLDRAKFRMPHRANVQFSLRNVLGAADLAMNNGHLKGWGQSPIIDPSLLYVRGFDAPTRRYKYEVNQRFGKTIPQFSIARSPVVLTTTLKFDLGAMRERQQLAQQIGFGRTIPGTRYPEQLFRSFGANVAANPMATILRQQDSLRLTATQADSLASMNRRYNFRSDSLWAPIARYYATLPERFNEDEAYDRYIRARYAQMDMLTQIVPLVRDLLTPEQRRKLPALVVNTLDPRYLASIREGNSLYLAGGGGGFPGIPIGFPAGAFVEFAVMR